MYRKALKLKLRFMSSQGPLTTEMLFDVKITTLAKMVKDQRDEVKRLQGSDDSELDFLEEKEVSEELAIAKLKFDVLKDVYVSRRDEMESARKAESKKEEIKKLAELIEKKKNQELENLSVDELEQRMRELQGEGK